MAEYEHLSEYFEELEPEVRATELDFEQIEHLIDDKLPPSAWHFEDWWSNVEDPGEFPQAMGWRQAGWHVVLVDQEKGWVRFERDPSERPI